MRLPLPINRSAVSPWAMSDGCLKNEPTPRSSAEGPWAVAPQSSKQSTKHELLHGTSVAENPPQDNR